MKRVLPRNRYNRDNRVLNLRGWRGSCLEFDEMTEVRSGSCLMNRSKLNTKCGRSPRFGRPFRSGDTGCWKNSLVAWRLRCLSRPGAHTSHHHESVVNWSMAGGTCHPVNKPYEITAALLESSCATASSPVYLNWSAPHMSSHTSWKIRSSTLN